MGVGDTTTHPDDVKTLFPDQFGRLAFVLDYGAGGTPIRFSTEGRSYLKAPLRDKSKWRMIYGGRQVGKSVILAVAQGSSGILSAPRRALYVAPTLIQAREFSSAKFDDVYGRSPLLKVFHDDRSRSVTEKRYILGSRLTLRYAFRHADRIRGISADDIFPDEVQDMDPDILPVIYEAAFRAPDPKFLLSGTQKSMDGPLQGIITREGRHLDWVIPCDHHSPSKWNILDEDSLDHKTNKLVCRYCQYELNMQHEKAQWVVTQSPPPGLDDPMNVYRICQPMEPSADLSDATRKLSTGQYSLTRYRNEVWARPHQHSSQPLTRDMIKACCMDQQFGWKYRMNYDDSRKLCGSMGKVMMGVDWGAGTEESHTLAIVGGYFRGKPTVAFAERVGVVGNGLNSVENEEIERVKGLHDDYGVDVMGCDFGLGYGRNMSLIKAYGLRRVKRIMLLNQSSMWKFDNDEIYFKISKSLFYDKVIDLIKRKQIVLPNWEDFAKPYAEDMTNIRREGGDGTAVRFFRPSGKPDDTFSALVFWVFMLALEYKLDNILRIDKDRKKK